MAADSTANENKESLCNDEEDILRAGEPAVVLPKDLGSTLSFKEIRGRH